MRIWDEARDDAPWQLGVPVICENRASDLQPLRRCSPLPRSLRGGAVLLCTERRSGHGLVARSPIQKSCVRMNWQYRCSDGLSSLRYENGPSRRFYDRKRSERQIHTQALLALARRLIDVLWALLRDGREITLDTPARVPAAA